MVLAGAADTVGECVVVEDGASTADNHNSDCCNDDEDDGPNELLPCAALPPGPAEHPSQYAGTMLLCAMVRMLGVPQALAMAGAKRGLRWRYTGLETPVCEHFPRASTFA